MNDMSRDLSMQEAALYEFILYLATETRYFGRRDVAATLDMAAALLKSNSFRKRRSKES